MKNKIGIIGHFGGGKTFLDGQTVKTKILYEELTKRGFDDIFCVDTYYNKTNKIKLMCDTLRCLKSCKTVIVLLSVNGLKVYLPLLYYAKKIFKNRIYHDVIGGNLAAYTRQNPDYVRYLNSFDFNWVEFSKMARELEALGVTNCDVVPNFKNLNIKNSKATVSDEGRYKFCMFSRVMAEKGMTDAIKSISNYNSNHTVKAKLEIWGPVDELYKDEFNQLLKENEDCVEYMGCVDFDKSVEVLTDHVALLFPTYWRSEGFPGTIIDAYASSVPVIASDWNANSELIRNFETGWVYPNEKTKTLDESIEWAMEHYDEMVSMRKNCTLMATRYTSDFVMRRIIEKYLKD